MLEEGTPSTLKEIRQTIPCVCSEFLKRGIEARQQHYFASQLAEKLEQENSLHIKVIAKPYDNAKYHALQVHAVVEKWCFKEVSKGANAENLNSFE